MTQKRRDKHGTEFSDWLRKQTEIDSKLGFIATNIDYYWTNYRSGLWMLIEEKRHKQLPRFYQAKAFAILDKSVRLSKTYKGFHILVFSNTSPDDGPMFLDGKFISRNDLFEFLRFEKDDRWYTSWCAEGIVGPVDFSMCKIKETYTSNNNFQSDFPYLSRAQAYEKNYGNKNN